MTLPNRNHAVIDIAKLRGYALNPVHPEGRHKARVFQASLGITASDAEWLADTILAALQSATTLEGETDEYGQRFIADLLIHRGNRSATVRTGWIVRSGEDIPRLVTCFIA
jgi:hypothetical protein